MHQKIDRGVVRSGSYWSNRILRDSPMDWQKLSEKDCCDALYQIGGALRRMGNFDLARRSEKIADALYPGEIKPLPIIPRTTT